MGLAALLLLLAGTALAQVLASPPATPDRARQGAGWALLLLALAQTVFAAQMGGRWLGLEGVGLALWLLAPARPAAILLLRHLAGYPLLAVALSGLLDTAPAPGQPLAALPAWVVLALLLSALVRAICTLPLFGPPPQPPTPNPQPPTPNPQPLLLYTAVAFYPLVRSLAAGPWDAWGRFAVVAVALTLLGGTTAYCVLRIAYPHLSKPQTSNLKPQTSYLVPR